MNKIALALIFLISVFTSTAQIQVSPANPTVTDSITLVYDATKGNQGLLDCNCDVYMHTGVITTQSTHPGDWKYVKAGWGTTDSSVLMTEIAANLYQARFRIDSFYGIPPTDTVIQLAFIFRNANGSLSGRSSSNGDIFYSIDLQSPSEIIDANAYDDGNEVILETDKGYVSFRAYREDVVRFKYQQTAVPQTDSSLMLTNWNPSHNLSKTSTSTATILDAGELEVHILHNPFAVFYIQNGDTLVKEERAVYSQFGKSGCFLSLKADEVITGTGFRVIDLNLKGEVLEVYNQAHYGYSRGARNANTAIPFYTSNKGYGVYFNNHHRATLDIGGSVASEMKYEVQSQDINYFVIAGPSYDEILHNYNEITGYQELPPLWSLGYIQSKYGYETEAEARSVVNSLKQNGYPVDALILDLYWFGDPSTMGNLDWDNTRFPNPQQMVNDFSNDGVKTILITETYFTQQSTNFAAAAANDYLATTDNGDPFIIGGFWAGSAGLLDMSNSDAREWFWDKYTQHIDMGIAGWWCDLGEPEAHPFEMNHQDGKAEDVHNTYSLEWAKLLHEKYKAEYPNQRLFNLIRSGYAGMQRYNAFPWSGDIQRSFDGLKIQVPIMLNMSMCGVPYMHSDLGGFVGGGKDDELYTRWMQLGTFSPIMRAHGTGMDTEPYNFGNSVQPHLKKAIRMRYELMPYTYSLSYLNTTTGRPLAMPMNYFERNNAMLSQAQYQFFWGEDMLVAPVLEQGKTSQTVVLPAGNWLDYESGQIYTGNQSISVSAPLGKTPVFVRGGSLLATTNDLENLEDFDQQAITVKYFNDKATSTSENEYYIDNGVDPNALANLEYDILKFEAERFSDSAIDILCFKNGPGYLGSPLEREMQLEIFNYESTPTSVSIGQAILQIEANLTNFNSKDTAAYYDASSNKVWVKFTWEMNPLRVQIRDTAITSTPPDPVFVEETKSLTVGSPYPNPFTESVFIDADFYETKALQFRVIDLNGRLVYNENVQVSNNSRRVLSWNGKTTAGEEVSAGLYFIQLQSDSETLTHKVFKQK